MKEDRTKNNQGTARKGDTIPNLRKQRFQTVHSEDTILQRQARIKYCVL